MVGRRATLQRLALLAQSVEHLHGKEGVDGSSPSEGLALRQGFARFARRDLLLIWRLGQIWVRSRYSLSLNLIRSLGAMIGGLYLAWLEPLNE